MLKRPSAMPGTRLLPKRVTQRRPAGILRRPVTASVRRRALGVARKAVEHVVLETLGASTVSHSTSVPKKTLGRRILVKRSSIQESPHGKGAEICLQSSDSEAESEAPEERLAEMMHVEALSQNTYYDLVAPVELNCWAFAWLAPTPPPLHNCCLVPTKACMVRLTASLAHIAADVVVSLGSGAGLVEWLLAPTHTVVCVDEFYKLTDNSVDEWVLPQLRSAVRARHGLEHVPGTDAQIQQPVFVDRGDFAGLEASVAGRSVALLLCWPQMQLSDIAEYVGGLCSVQGLVMIAGDNCLPDPSAAASVVGCQGIALHEDVECLSEPCTMWTFT
uniref:Uncharacterized protein n=1 Tax=Noctiluca scintillans TaxID=2966 RepID=A0A7S1A8N0_NOCSC|mmetsp:Transcript_36151/g.96018  ORF Transcript_36151/g.96018 Transcript_36151/m.96018 type:complete len:332 (+) Transcript_36151:176-1171(+)